MIAILTSGAALGVHVPGLLLSQRIKERGGEAQVFVLERYTSDTKRAATARTKFAFHRDFRLALLGQRLVLDPATEIADEAVWQLADQWLRGGLKRIVIFSGFWLPVIARCVELNALSVEVDVCHVDSVLSPSFRAHGDFLSRTRQMWLANAERSSLPCTIQVSARGPLLWDAREDRLLVHGGGWGMGTYRERINDLSGSGFELDVVTYEPGDLSPRGDGIRYFMIDPLWHPWLDNGFPPFGRVGDNGMPTYIRGTECHGSFELARLARAMVSKPGGGTLLDSLHAATPLILLEPFGEHEARNAALWERLGFGISFERWRETGFALMALEEMHERLLRAYPAVPDYTRILVGA